MIASDDTLRNLVINKLNPQERKDLLGRLENMSLSSALIIFLYCIVLSYLTLGVGRAAVLQHLPEASSTRGFDPTASFDPASRLPGSFPSHASGGPSQAAQRQNAGPAFAWQTEPMLKSSNTSQQYRSPQSGASLYDDDDEDDGPDDLPFLTLRQGDPCPRPVRRIIEHLLQKPLPATSGGTSRQSSAAQLAEIIRRAKELGADGLINVRATPLNDGTNMLEGEAVELN